MTKSRKVHLLLIALTIPMGLASRSTSLALPGLVLRYGGDVLSATCIFFGVRFVMDRTQLARCAVVAFVICVLIELQQLLTFAWLVKLREETPADVLLGHCFLWSDLVCYAIGVAVGVGLSKVARQSMGEQHLRF